MSAQARGAIARALATLFETGVTELWPLLKSVSSPAAIGTAAEAEWVAAQAEPLGARVSVDAGVAPTAADDLIAAARRRVAR